MGLIGGRHFVRGGSVLEFIWHARVGGGLYSGPVPGAAAALSAGAYALAFPTFGPERRGAPMRAFTKIDTAPIGDRSAVHRAAFVIYLDRAARGRRLGGRARPRRPHAAEHEAGP